MTVRVRVRVRVRVSRARRHSAALTAGATRRHHSATPAATATGAVATSTAAAAAANTAAAAAAAAASTARDGVDGAERQTLAVAEVPLGLPLAPLRAQPACGGGRAREGCDGVVRWRGAVEACRAGVRWGGAVVERCSWGVQWVEGGCGGGGVRRGELRAGHRHRPDPTTW